MSILHDLVNPPKPRRPGLAAPNIEPDYMKQTYRAIGNCCFEFGKARKDRCIMDLLKSGSLDDLY